MANFHMRELVNRIWKSSRKVSFLSVKRENGSLCFWRSDWVHVGSKRFRQGRRIGSGRHGGNYRLFKRIKNVPRPTVRIALFHSSFEFLLRIFLVFFSFFEARKINNGKMFRQKMFIRHTAITSLRIRILFAMRRAWRMAFSNDCALGTEPHPRTQTNWPNSKLPEFAIWPMATTREKPI